MTHSGQPCRHTRPHLFGLLALTAPLSATATVLAPRGVGAFHQARTPPGPQRLVVASRSWTHTTLDTKEATQAGEVGPPCM
ncbi:hypothetical protein ABT168_00280 [Streptomyces sp. NPDC001793]|uniref:hypothetical protein n=1 Tax=Streptomyces sp. NPDC001793 TaxID=3154657 RepID=UPI0033297B5E